MSKLRKKRREIHLKFHSMFPWKIFTMAKLSKFLLPKSPFVSTVEDQVLKTQMTWRDAINVKEEVFISGESKFNLASFSKYNRLVPNAEVKDK